MARKRPNPLDVPPAASSSEEEEEEVEEQDGEDDRPNAQPDASESDDAVEDDEEEGDGEEEEDDEEEEEEEEEEEKSLPPLSQPKPLESEDESETESESGSKSAGFTIKSHTSNSAVSVKPNKSTGKASSMEKESLKRPAEVDPKESKSKVKKKAKSDNGGGGGEGVVAEKKPPSSKWLWSEEDEITVLKGMIEFHDKNGVDPNSNSTAFHEFVKKKLSVDVSKSQLMEKVRRFKNKYKNNVEKGDGAVFPKPHDLEAFELSKKIWADLDNNGNKKSSRKKNSVDENAKDTGKAVLVTALPKVDTLFAVKNKHDESKVKKLEEMEVKHQEDSKVKNQEESKVEEGKFSDLYPFLYLSLKTNNFSAALMSKDTTKAMESCLVSVEKSKLEELEKEWKKQILAEAQVNLGRSVLLQKQVQLMSDWCSRRG